MADDTGAVTETRYEQDGQTFVCLERGPSDGPPVVLQHGFPDRPAHWDPVATRLASLGYRVIAPWLRGYHADTVVPGRAYAVDVLGDDLVRLLAAACDRPAVAVGHDWGAMAVWAAANLAPARLAAIVPVAIPHARALPPTPGTAWAVRHFLALRLPTAEATVRRADFAYLDTLLHRFAPNWTGAEPAALLADAKALLADPERLTAVLAYYRGFSPPPPRASTDRVPVPGLVVAGALDLGGRAEAFRRSADVGFAKGTPARAHVIADVGHWPHREAEDEFLAVLQGFLAEVLPVA